MKIRKKINKILALINVCWCERCRKLKLHPCDYHLRVMREEDDSLIEEIHYIICNACAKELALEAVESKIEFEYLDEDGDFIE